MLHNTARATAAQVARPETATVDALLPSARARRAWQADDKVDGGSQSPLVHVKVSNVLPLSQETSQVAPLAVAVHDPVTPSLFACGLYDRAVWQLPVVLPVELASPVTTTVAVPVDATVAVSLLVEAAVETPLVVSRVTPEVATVALAVLAPVLAPVPAVLAEVVTVEVTVVFTHCRGAFEVEVHVPLVPVLEPTQV